MQSPSIITQSNDRAILKYGIIERITTGLTFTQFVQAQFQNAISAGLISTDPVLQIPSLVQNYQNLMVNLVAECVWYMPTTAYGVAVVDLRMLKWNNVNQGALVIKQNGQPISAMLSPIDTLPLQCVPGTLDFSQMGIRYSVSTNPNFGGWAVDTVPATNQVQIYVSAEIVAYNGTN